MAHEDRTPDFDDLLAAFDIPDVPSIPASKEHDPNSNHQMHGYHHIDAAMCMRQANDSSDKSCLEDKKKLLPTSKLTLGVTSAIHKRALATKPPGFNLPVNNVNTVKSVPVLSNRQASKLQMVTTNTKPITTPLVTISNDELDVLLSPRELASNDTTYQLSTNVLPPYVPMMQAPEKFKLTLPPEGYKCAECGDRFLFEASLTQHLKRRSVYITFNCETCQKALVYYNRCNLLNHIRSHREKNQTADIKKADITPLPRELLCHIQSISTSPPTAQPNGSVVQKVPTPVSSSSSVNGPPRVKVGVQNADGKFRCSECSQLFENATAIEDHFGRSQNMPLATSQCSKCNMTCPSKCSLASHQRIHLQSKPFICPECGQNVSDNWTAFQRHLSVKCLHYSRTIGYKCSTCYILYNNGELLRKHIISVHSESYYKCQACPMAFKAGNTFDTHKKTAHLTMDVQCKMIFKCPLCDTVFHSSEQLHTHLDVHIKEQIRATKFVFKCLECCKLMDSKPALADHMKEAHLNIVNKEACMNCGALFDDEGALALHKKDMHPAQCPSPPAEEVEIPKQTKVPTHQGLTKCEQCNRVFQTGHGYNIHKQRCHSSNNAALVCFVCNCKCSSRAEMAVHGRRHQEEGMLVCTVCNNHTFESRNGLAKHLDTHAANMKLPAKCNLCSEVMNDVTAAARHLKIEHGFSSFGCQKCDMHYFTMKSLLRHERVMHSPEGSRRKYVCWICKERNFGKRALLEKHIVLAHKIPTEDIDFSQMPKPSRPPIKIKIPRPVYMAAVKQELEESEIPAKKLRASDQNGGYLCFKCDFTSETRTRFLEHIALHKSDPHSLQCHECGTCFVVEPSLRKHLLIVHKVKNVDQYLVDEGQSSEANSDVDPVFDINGSGNPLECNVCFQMFPTDLSLKTHLRTHGMAFIRSKRLTNTSESSPSSS